MQLIPTEGHEILLKITNSGTLITRVPLPSQICYKTFKYALKTTSLKNYTMAPRQTMSPLRETVGGLFLVVFRGELCSQKVFKDNHRDK